MHTSQTLDHKVAQQIVMTSVSISYEICYCQCDKKANMPSDKCLKSSSATTSDSPWHRTCMNSITRSSALTRHRIITWQLLTLQSLETLRTFTLLSLHHSAHYRCTGYRIFGSGWSRITSGSLNFRSGSRDVGYSLIDCYALFHLTQLIQHIMLQY